MYGKVKHNRIFVICYFIIIPVTLYLAILVGNKSSAFQLPTSDSYMERPVLDVNAVKVELEELDELSYMVYPAENTNVKIEDITSNESTGRLM